MKSMEVLTTDSNWAHSYVDRTGGTSDKTLYKLLKIEDFGFYLNPNDSLIIH